MSSGLEGSQYMYLAPNGESRKITFTHQPPYRRNQSEMTQQGGWENSNINPAFFQQSNKYKGSQTHQENSVKQVSNKVGNENQKGKCDLKKLLIIIGAILAVAAITVLLVFLLKSEPDYQTSANTEGSVIETEQAEVSSNGTFSVSQLRVNQQNLEQGISDESQKPFSSSQQVLVSAIKTPQESKQVQNSEPVSSIQQERVSFVTIPEENKQIQNSVHVSFTNKQKDETNSKEEVNQEQQTEVLNQETILKIDENKLMTIVSSQKDNQSLQNDQKQNPLKGENDGQKEKQLKISEKYKQQVISKVQEEANQEQKSLKISEKSDQKQNILDVSEKEAKKSKSLKEEQKSENMMPLVGDKVDSKAVTYVDQKDEISVLKQKNQPSTSVDVIDGNENRGTKQKEEQLPVIKQSGSQTQTQTQPQAQQSDETAIINPSNFEREVFSIEPVAVQPIAVNPIPSQ